MRRLTELDRDDARRVDDALKLSRRNEKISPEEIFVRRRAEREF
jgi:hypothetical protein